MGIEGDVVSCLYNHVITHNLWNSSNVYCVLFIFICFSVSSSILCGILPLSSLIPNIFSKEFLSLRHLILGNKDQSHASTHHKLWNDSYLARNSSDENAVVSFFQFFRVIHPFPLSS